MQKIIRVNMTEGTITYEDVPAKYRLLGGRALTSRLVADEVPAGCDPWGPLNKLIIAPGLLGGTPMSSSSRLSIGGKSPLTGTIKESNAGGTAAHSLSRLRVKAVIIEGESTTGYAQYLYLGEGTAELRPAEFALKGVYESARILYDRYSKKTSLILIGPAGERSLASAGITNTDPQGRPGRYCGRGGLGAVMGLKGLKAIVVDPQGAPGVEYANAEAFRGLVKEMVKLLQEHPVTGETYPKYGTPAMAARTNAMHGLPTRNFSQGSFEHAGYIHGEYMAKVIEARGGEGTPTHSCMPGCVIRCSNVYADADGKEIVAPLEYETIGLLGSNCGIGNLDDIARLNYICNDLGLDTIEIGAAVAVALEQGLGSFGDAGAVEDLLMEIQDNTILGRVLGQGTAVTGRVLGSRRIPVVKGQALAAYDPRAIKGLGVTYATSPMGADHTAGATVRAQVDHTDPNPQPELSRKAQRLMMLADSAGFCIFALAALGVHLDKVAGLVESLTGESFNADKLLEMSVEAIKVERDFNRAAGFGPVHDRIPEFMTREPLPVINSVFDVPAEELDKLHE